MCIEQHAARAADSFTLLNTVSGTKISDTNQITVTVLHIETRDYERD